MIEPEVAGTVGTILTTAVAGLWRRCVVLEDRSRQDALTMQEAVRNLTEALREANRKVS